MKLVVSNTSSLILLSKAGVLEKACRRYEINIPLSVEKEASSSKLREKYSNALQIHDLIRSDALKVRKLTVRKKKMPVTLGRGEADAIRLFLELQAECLLTDDGKAIKVCRMLGIPFIISPSIVLNLCRNEALTHHEALQSLEKLRLFGRYSPDIIAAALLRIQRERDDA